MNITLGSITKKIIKKWYVVLIAVIVMVIAALVYSTFLVEPKYVNNATASIKDSDTVSSAPISDAEFNEFKKLLENDDFIIIIKDSMDSYGIADLNMQDLQLDKVIVLNEDSKSSLITFTSTYHDAKLSHQILTAYVETLEAYFDAYPLYNNVDVFFNIGFIEEASVININDNLVKVLVLSIALALLFSVIGLIIYFCAAKRLNHILDFNSEFDIKILGTITYDNNGNLTSNCSDEPTQSTENSASQDEEVCHD